MNFLPTNCPCCNSVLVWAGVDLKCDNKGCGDTLVKSLASFLIKAGVEGATDTSLTNWNISTVEDLLNWNPSPDYKSELKFAKEIKEKIFSKTQEELFPCMTFNGAGETNINKLIDFYGEGNLITASKILYFSDNDQMFFDMVGYPEGIGQKVIDKIKEDWIANLKTLKLILMDSRYAPVAKTVLKPASTVLNGKTFCITGTLTKKRSEVEKMIIDNGGTIASVSKKLDYLIVGEDAGSKEDKAKKLGVKILTEKEFEDMI